MQTLFVVGREENYARNEVLYRAFSRFSNVDKITPKTKPKSLILNSILLAAKTVTKLQKQPYDLVFIGFYGYIVLRLIAPFVRSPLLFDAFVSNFDTLCFDRKVFSPNSILGKASYWLDKSTLHLSDQTILDTQAHAAFFSKTFNIPLSHFKVLPVGCNDEIFPLVSPKVNKDETQVLYYSSFLPLHGAGVIVQAAALLREKPIHFKLIGNGPDLANIKRVAATLRLNNISFIPPIHPQKLAHEISESDICLGGHFGTSGKAKRVIPGKIYQMLAVGRPIIALDYPGNRELLTHEETAFLINESNPELLASAIDTLHKDTTFRINLGERGRTLYESRCSESVISKKLMGIVDELLVS